MRKMQRRKKIMVLEKKIITAAIIMMLVTLKQYYISDAIKDLYLYVRTEYAAIRKTIFRK